MVWSVPALTAGGEGARLRPLTMTHTKPALPFGGNFRLIDFVLSNLVNSEIASIYLLAQYKPESLIDHVNANWRFAAEDRGLARRAHELGEDLIGSDNARPRIGRLRISAISPVDEMELTSALVIPRERDSALPARVENNSPGFPSQCAA